MYTIIYTHNYTRGGGKKKKGKNSTKCIIFNTQHLSVVKQWQYIHNSLLACSNHIQRYVLFNNLTV